MKAVDPAPFRLGSGETVGLRRAHADDIASIIVVERAQFSHPWKEEHFRHEVDNELARFVVAETTPGQRLAAYMIIWLIPPLAELHTIAVAAAYQRQGLATWLLDFAMRQSRDAGCQKMFLDVRPSNGGAILLYEKLGFCRQGTRRGYYQQPAEDAYVYALELSS